MLSFYPEEIVIVKYNEDTSSYYCEIKLKNNSDKDIYLHVVSTFYNFIELHMKQNPLQHCAIGSNDQLTLLFKIKPTNQINAQTQKIIISYDKRKENNYYITQTSEKKVFKLKYQQEFVVDEMIEMILKGDAESLCDQARKYYNNSQYKKAHNLYQEAFQLYRSCIQAIQGLAACLIQQNQQQKALRAIQTGLILNNNSQKLKVLKCKCLLSLIRKGKLNHISTKKSIKDIINSVNQNDKESEDWNKIEIEQKIHQKSSSEQIEQILKELKLISRNSQQTIFNQYIEHLKKKVQENFDNKPQLNKIFKDKNQCLNMTSIMLNIEQKLENITTPQYVIDSITYQIINDPLIVPTGLSYDKNFLMLYLKTHGNKDPHTRLQLQPYWILPNNALKKYIKEHPDYTKWQMYQIQMITPQYS